ncbi:hypothetical protein TNCV_1723231 [Trichonephila clavipes]|nr:hypothetical protein TNCV_1723231 [Trichonephila clavipes]
MGLDCMPVVRYSFEHHAGGSTIWVVPPPQFWGRTPWGGQRGLPSPLTSRRGLMARRLFRVPPCRKRTKHLILKTSMPTAGFKPKPYGKTAPGYGLLLVFSRCCGPPSAGLSIGCLGWVPKGPGFRRAHISWT